VDRPDAGCHGDTASDGQPDTDAVTE